MKMIINVILLILIRILYTSKKYIFIKVLFFCFIKTRKYFGLSNYMVLINLENVPCKNVAKKQIYLN